jgi:raffinose/stachyose/melibiose transport system permease protein
MRLEELTDVTAVLRRLPPTKVLVTAVVLAFAAVFAYPAFLTVVTSLKSQNDVISSPLGVPSHLSGSAFTTTWSVLSFGRLLVNSLFYAGVGAGIGLLLSIYPAYAFSRFRFFGSRTIFIMLLTTLMLPQQTALLPLYDALTRLGLLNTRLGLVIIHAAWGMPLQLLLLTGFLANQPRELEEAAKMDGARDFQLLRYVVLPLALPAMAVGFVLNFVGIWKEFIFALTFLNSDNLYPLTVGILKFTASQYFTSFTLPAAAVVISQLPLILLFLFVHRWPTRGIYAGAIK